MVLENEARVQDTWDVPQFNIIFLDILFLIYAFECLYINPYYTFWMEHFFLNKNTMYYVT